MITNEESTVNPWRSVGGRGDGDGVRGDITRHVLISLVLLMPFFISSMLHRGAEHIEVAWTGAPRMDVAGLLICNRGHGVSFWAHQTNLLESVDGNSCELTTLNVNFVLVCPLTFFGWRYLNICISLFSQKVFSDFLAC